MRRENTEIKFFLENLISGWKQNDETEFFPQNLVSFYHNSAGSSEWIASAIELPCAPYKMYFSNKFLTTANCVK